MSVTAEASAPRWQEYRRCVHRGCQSLQVVAQQVIEQSFVRVLDHGKKPVLLDGFLDAFVHGHGAS